MGLLRTHTNEDLWGRRFHAAAALPGGVLFSQEHGSVSCRVVILLGLSRKRVSTRDTAVVRQCGSPMWFGNADV